MSKVDYDKIVSLGLGDTLEKSTDKFIEKYPKFKGKETFFDKMYVDQFAEMKKSEDGLCVNLDRKTMLCGIYESRPECCKTYTTDRCSKIRKLCTS
jgi:Fe-S-cluster containining protein